MRNSAHTLDRREKMLSLVDAFQGEVLPLVVNEYPLNSDDPLVRRAYAVHMHLTSQNQIYQQKVQRFIGLVSQFNQTGVIQRLEELGDADGSIGTDLKAIMMILPHAPLFIRGKILEFQLTRMAKPLLERELN